MALQSAQSYRIIVANSSRLLREVLQRALSSIPGLEVIGETVNLKALLFMIEHNNPQWLIASLLPDGQLPDALESLLVKFPSLNILAVAVDGSQVQMRGMTLRREETFKDLSFDDMVRILSNAYEGFKPSQGSRDCGARVTAR